MLQPKNIKNMNNNIAPSIGEQEYAEQRKKGFGSSDSKMLYQVAITDSITNQARERIAVLLGFVEKKEIRTKAMADGFEIENALYEVFLSQHKDAKSNHVYVSDKLSTDKFLCWTRPDFSLEDETTLTFIECKASIHPIEKVKNTYVRQLMWHYVIGVEIAKRLGLKFKLKLLYYNTVGFDGNLHSENVYIEDITFANVSKISKEFRKGVDLIYNALDNFEYKDKGEQLMTVDDLCDELSLSLESIQKLPELSEDPKVIEYLDLQKKAEKIKKFFYEVMIANDIDKPLTFVDLGLKFTLKKPYVKVDIDKQALEKKEPKIYDEYKILTTVKGNVQLKTIKK